MAAEWLGAARRVLLVLLRELVDGVRERVERKVRRAPEPRRHEEGEGSAATGGTTATTTTGPSPPDGTGANCGGEGATAGEVHADDGAESRDAGAARTEGGPNTSGSGEVAPSPDAAHAAPPVPEETSSGELPEEQATSATPTAAHAPASLDGQPEPANPNPTNATSATSRDDGSEAEPPVGGDENSASISPPVPDTRASAEEGPGSTNAHAKANGSPHASPPDDPPPSALPIPPPGVSSPAIAALDGDPLVDPHAERRPRKFRPAKQLPPIPRTQSTRSTGPREANRRAREQAFPIDVRVLFERGGFLRVSLLARRDCHVPPEISASGVDLVSLNDDWYEDVLPPDLGTLLERGIEWSARVNGKVVRWSLAGREVYVLARHNRLNGFINAPRLVLQEQHVVLCSASRLDGVERCLVAAGCSDVKKIDASLGTPAGWVALTNIVPTTPVPQPNDGDILDVLCPRADVEIVLEGGIRIDRSSWLHGFPPAIRLRGDAASAGAVHIDGKEATCDEAGHFTADGWDERGEHTVWCHGMLCSYQIGDGAEEWEPWDAYVWSLGEGDPGETRRPGICGMLVRPPPAAPPGARSITVPATNLILIGAVPGAIEFCSGRRDLRASTCAVFPPFDPVWALPSDLRRCDNRAARILLLRREPPATDAQAGRVVDWYEAILAASRKGLRIEPGDADAWSLWGLYKEVARARRRRRRRRP